MSKYRSSPPGANSASESVRMLESIFKNIPPVRSPTLAPRRFISPTAADVDTSSGVKETVSAAVMATAATELAEKSGAPPHVLPVPLPLEGFVRLASILAPKGPIPVSASTWWAGVKSGLFPAPLHLGSRMAVWRVEDIRKVIESPPVNSGSSQKKE